MVTARVFSVQTSAAVLVGKFLVDGEVASYLGMLCII